MLKEMGTGLVVTELMGQGVSGVTGDYSRGASGFWVENGEIQYPVSEITIAGNLKEMWRNIVTIGDDIETRSNIHSVRFCAAAGDENRRAITPVCLNNKKEVSNA